MSIKTFKSTFDTLTWEETPVKLASESEAKVTRVRTERTFIGDLVGTAITEYVFSYHPFDGAVGLDPSHPKHGTVNYTGLMHFKGTIGGSEPGEVVFLVSKGEYTDAARGEWIVDEKSARGGLKGIKGKGGYTSTSMKATPAWFELEM